MTNESKGAAPAALTLAKVETMADLVRSGAEVAHVALHPYSGAATLAASWTGHSETLAIIDPDGRVTYRAEGATS